MGVWWRYDLGASRGKHKRAKRAFFLYESIPSSLSSQLRMETCKVLILFMGVRTEYWPKSLSKLETCLGSLEKGALKSPLYPPMQRPGLLLCVESGLPLCVSQDWPCVWSQLGEGFFLLSYKLCVLLSDDAGAQMSMVDDIDLLLLVQRAGRKKLYL